MGGWREGDREGTRLSPALFSKTHSSNLGNLFVFRSFIEKVDGRAYFLDIHPLESFHVACTDHSDVQQRISFSHVRHVNTQHVAETKRTNNSSCALWIYCTTCIRVASLNVVAIRVRTSSGFSSEKYKLLKIGHMPTLSK